MTLSTDLMTSHEVTPFSQRENPVLRVIQEFQNRTTAARARVVKREDFSWLYREEEANRKWFKGAFQTAHNKRPKTRPRTTGRVGPELDWSVVYSDVDRERLRATLDVELGHLGKAHHHGHVLPWFQGVFAPQTALHNQVAVCFISKRDEVVRWTQWAHANNVHFSGARNYEFRKALLEPTARARANYSVLKCAGEIPTHKRSPMALLRRTLNRAVRMRSNVYDISVVTRRYRPSREIKAYWRTLQNVPYRVAKATMGIEPQNFLVYHTRRRAVRLTDIALNSLRVIYSRSESHEGPVKIPVLPKTVVPTIFKPVVRLPVPPPTRVFNPLDPENPFLLNTTGSYQQVSLDRSKA